MRGIRLLAVCIACLIGTANAAPAAPAPTTTRAAEVQHSLATEHYDLITDGPDPEPIGRLLEAFFDFATDYFGQAPNVRLKVYVFGTEAAYHEAAEATLSDDLADYHLGTWGMFYPDKGIVHVYLPLPVGEGGERTLLHEAAHQFQYLRRGVPISPQSRYYIEGIAHTLELLKWDGQTLRMPEPNEVPSIETVAALDAWRNGMRRSVRSLAVDQRSPRGPGAAEARALVQFLRHVDADRFAAWSDDIERSATLEEAFDLHFGDVPELDARYGRWLEAQNLAAPWWSADVGWKRTDTVIEAPATYGSLLFLRPLDRPVTIECEGQSDEFAVTVFFDYLPHDPLVATRWISVRPEEFAIQQMDQDGYVGRPLLGHIPKLTPSHFTVHLEPAGETVSVFINGEPVREHPNRRDTLVGLAAAETPMRYTITVHPPRE